MTDQTTDPAPNSARSDGVPGGLQDDPGASALQEGEFGLDGDLRATMLAALEQKWNADDPGSTQLDDDSPADTEPLPAPAPSSPATGEDGAGAGEGAAPIDPDPGTPPTADGDDFSLDAYAQEYFGTRLTKDQSRELFGMLGGLQAMSPDQRAQLDAILAGGQTNQYPATTGQPITPAQQQQPQQSSAPPVSNLPPRPADDDYEAQRLYDTYIAPLAASTQEQLSALQAEQSRITQAQLARQHAETVTIIEAESAKWRAEHPVLTDGEYDALTDRIARSGVFAPMIHSQGSPAAATRAALDQFFWADPTFRDRAVANIASGRQAGDPNTVDPTSAVAQQQAEITSGRQARAGSVVGGGGSTTSRGQAPTPKDADSRRAALIQALATEGDFS